MDRQAGAVQEKTIASTATTTTTSLQEISTEIDGMRGAYLPCYRLTRKFPDLGDEVPASSS